jgi:hypothetical protein
MATRTGPAPVASDSELINRWDAGESMTEIANAVGLTRERVRQRLKKHGRSGPNHNARHSREAILGAAAGAVSIGQVAKKMQISAGRLLIEVRHYSLQEELDAIFQSVHTAWRERRIENERQSYVRTLRRIAVEVGHTPTTNELAKHDVYHARLALVFGSANAAMEAAGLVPNLRGRPPIPLPNSFLEMDQPTADDETLSARVELLMAAGPAETAPEGIAAPAKAEITTIRYCRDPRVAAWVLEQACGVCESCGTEGYETDSGSRYLEVHHVVPLADGGADTIANAAAVCELCHGKLHRAKDRMYLRQQLYESVPRLAPGGT